MERYNYQRMVHDALRQVVHQALSETAEHGLDGDHHFFISYYTQHPGVEIPQRLLERFPETITIVLQNQFWSLEVDDEGFSVTLTFGGSPEQLRVPYSAIETFSDPSAEFGLRFEPEGFAGEAEAGEEATEEKAEGDAAPAESVDGKSNGAGGTDADVVSIDQFRRK